MPFELQPERNVELVDGHCIATTDEPWLALDPTIAPALSGRLIEITYRASFWDEPARPVVRFWFADGTHLDRIATGPIAGAGLWTGRVPRGTSRISISPTNRPGRFDFRIERLRTRAWLALLLKGMRQNPKSARSTLLTKLIGWGPESDVNLAWATGGVPLTDYAAWLKTRARPIDLAGIDRPRFDWATAPPMHIVVIEGDRRKLAATIASLNAQAFPSWKATILSDDAALVSSDMRVAVVPVAGQTAVSDASVSAITTVLKAGEILAPSALAYVAEQAHRHPACRLFYGDALHRSSDSVAVPALRPGFSLRLVASRPWMDGPLFLRDLSSWDTGARQAFLETGQLPTCSLTELCAAEMRPLRRVLLETDPSSLMVRRPQAVSNQISSRKNPAVPRSRPLESLVVRDALRAPHHEGVAVGVHVSKESLTAGVAVIIPTRDHPALLRRAVASIQVRSGPRRVQIVIVDNGSATVDAQALLAELARQPDVLVLRQSGPFNFSLMCNRAAAAASGDVLVFLNDDTEVLTRDWLDRLVAHALAPDIGAVGAKLTYPDGRLQHVGVLVGMGGSAGHFGALQDANAPGWAGRNHALHDVAAVTGACLAVARAKFEAVAGFDAEHLPVELGDVDLCLRLNARGWQSVIDPAIHLMHEESASRGGATLRRLDVYASQRALFIERWGHILRDDPVFHPGLSLYSWQAALG